MIEESMKLLGQIRDRLKFLNPSIRSLIENLDRSGQFESLQFVKRCAGDMVSGMTFPESWRDAVYVCASGVGKEEARIIASLSDILGQADIEAQLAAIAFANERLAIRLEDARARRAKYAKLYRTLGVLCGIMLVIILI